MITIAIDGPGSSGKGTVAREVARRLGFSYVDTGAMYRGVALAARRRGIDWADASAVARLASALQFDFGWDGKLLRVFLDGSDVTTAIRTSSIGAGASVVSRHPEVRSALLQQQCELARAGGTVMDGRDIGTVVAPDAAVKVYLDASLEERARRRHAELVAKGESTTLAAVAEALAERDRRDTEREVAPLRRADDARYLDCTSLEPAEVVELVVGWAKAAIGASPA